jgi:hypothetical protein
MQLHAPSISCLSTHVQAAFLQKINIYFNLVKGKQFDIQQLKENLLKLIEKSNVDNNQLDHTDQLIQKYIFIF